MAVGEPDFGEKPKEVLPDAGYHGEEALVALETRDLTAYVVLDREGKRQGAVAKKRPVGARMAKRLARPAGRARYGRRK